ncbi:11261_t:CDS:2, partial [Acaulospora colombiana]
EKLQKNRYRNIIDVLNDLHLVFANALHYNEASSQIAKDAAVLKSLFEQLWKDDPYLPNAQPTKQPGRKPGFRAAPLPRMSSFATPMRHSGGFQPSYSTAMATVQVKPIGKPPAPIVAPRLQPLKKGKRKRTQKQGDLPSTSDSRLISRPRRPGSPAFSEINFNSNLEVEDDDSEVPQTHIANEAETDVIVQRLDTTLPKWEPWQQTAENTVILNSGWMTELHGGALQAKLEEFVSRMKSFLNAS